MCVLFAAIMRNETKNTKTAREIFESSPFGEQFSCFEAQLTGNSPWRWLKRLIRRLGFSPRYGRIVVYKRKEPMP